jgi:hypothetical protein
MIDIREWRSKEKGKLIIFIKKTIENRRGLTCEHCDHRYDDDMCDACLARHLVGIFENSLTPSKLIADKEGIKSNGEVVIRKIEEANMI